MNPKRSSAKSTAAAQSSYGSFGGPSVQDRAADVRLHAHFLDAALDQPMQETAFLASVTCQVPMAVIGLVDEQVEWFRARVGLEAQQLPRADSFSAHAILKPTETMLLADTLQDERFCHHPWVQGEPRIRFYAGVPLVFEDGTAIGVLAVMDVQPRELDPRQLAALQLLGRRAAQEFEQHQVAAELEAQRCQAAAILYRYELLIEYSRDIILIFRHADGCILEANPAALLAYGYSREELLQLRFAQLSLSPTGGQPAGDGPQGGLYETTHRRKDGSAFQVEISSQSAEIEGDALRIAIIRDITERKLQQAHLVESEEMFNKAFRSSPQLIAIFEQSSNRYVDCNDTFMKTLEYAREDIIGRDSFDVPIFAHVSQRQAALKLFALEGKLKNFPTEFRTRTGKIRSGLLSAEYIEIADRRLILVVMNDVTEQFLAEQKLLESEEKFRLIAETIEEVFWMADPQINRMLYISPGYERVWGRTCQSLYEDPRSFIDAILPEDREQALQVLIKQKHGEPFAHEYRIRHLDGPVRTIWDRGYPVWDLAGNLSRYVGVAQDITLRKQTEETLRHSEQSLKNAQRIARIGNWELDLLHNRLTWSDEIFRIFELDPQHFAVTYEAFLNSIHPEDRVLVDQAYSESLRTGQPYQITHRLLMPDGRVKYVTEICETNFDEQGRALRSIGTVHDVTDVKLAELAKQQSEENYLRIVDQSPIIVYEDLIGGPWLFVSPQIEFILGFTPKDFYTIPRLWMSCVHPDDRERVRRNVSQAQPGQEMVLEYRFIRPDGREVWLHDEAVIVQVPDSSTLLLRGIMYDITEQRKAAEALQLSEEKYRGLVASLDNIIVSVDLDGQILFYNKIAEDLFGGGAVAHTGAGLQDFLPPEIAARQLEGVRRVFQEDKKYTVVSQSIVQNKPRWYRTSLQPIHDENGRVIQVLINANDIDDLKTAQRELEDLNHTLEARVTERTTQVQDLYDNAPCGYHSLDAEGRFIRVNQTELNLLGYAREELLGRPISSILPPEERERYKLLYEQYKTSGKVNDLEVEILCKDGHRIQVALSSRAVFAEDGQFLESRTTLIDISERKQVEEQLRFQSNLLNVVGQAVVVTDLQGSIIYLNQAAQDLYGWPSSAAVGHSVMELFVPETTQEQGAEIMAMVLAGKTWSGEFLVRRRDGSTFWAHVTDTPIYNQAGQMMGVIGISMDITARRWAEDALRTSEARLSYLFSNTPAIIFTTHFDENLTTTFISESVRHILGYDPRFYLEDSLFGAKTIHPEDAEAYKQVFPALIKTGNASFDCRIRHADGEYRWMTVAFNLLRDAMGRPLEVIGYTIDITLRKMALEALRESEEQNRLLFEKSPDAVLLLDEAYRVVRINQAGEVATGCQSQQIQGRRLDELKLLSKGQVEKLEDAIIKALHLVNNFCTTELLLVRENGETRSMEVQIFALKLQGSQRFLTTMHDITAERHTEEALRLANAEMQRALRMKDEFLANMSHELRTPLNAILGISESMGGLIAGPLSDKQIRYLSIIHESGQHLLALINDILDLSKVEAGRIDLNIASVNIRQVCESSLRMIKELTLKKQQMVRFEIAAGLDTFRADERRLKQMLVNLLSNAVKYTPEGGQLGLLVSGDPIKKEIIFTVWDSGIGIKSEDLSRLFQPFVQLDASLTREQSGTGLGLALVARLARLHGGRVGVESDYGRGSRFSFFLPWSSGSPAALSTPAAAAVSVPTAPAVPGKGKILLVEDTEPMIVFVKDYLEANLYEVLVARNGLEALALAKQALPDLILMDVQMPVMDGFEATRRIRAEAALKNVPIIALTALAMPGDLDRCVEAGMNDYLSKPVQMTLMLKTIQRLLGS